MFSIIESYTFTSTDYQKVALDALDSIEDKHKTPNFHFIKSQLKMLLLPPKGRRFDKTLIVLAAELHAVSSGAYKLLRKSGAISLPCTKIIKQMLSCSMQDKNLAELFRKLKPQQCLVNVLFDEVKLIQVYRYSGGHVLGCAENESATLEDGEILATHALVVEIVCHFGGPKYILRVCPVAKLKTDDLKVIIFEGINAIIKAGGSVVSLICDNHTTNQSFYNFLGGPGRVYIDVIGCHVFLVYDYVHIFKNVRNNWITVTDQELSFLMDGKNYTARWADIKALYDEDRKTMLRLTKLTHTSVFPKPLQRQSVPLVCQVFNDKTVAALQVLQTKLAISQGTIEFVRLITDWFKMNNVKDKYSAMHLRDECREPWTLGCQSFVKLEATCVVIESCTWEGGKGRKLKLTKQTGNAFTSSTRTNIETAKYLLTDKDFSYFLSAIDADEALEKFFGKARMRSCGNFYIDMVDVAAAAKVTNLHALLQYDLLPEQLDESNCPTCSQDVSEDDIDSISDYTVEETEMVIDSDDCLKHKIIYIAGHLIHKFGNDEGEELLYSTEFIESLSRGGLTVPTLSATFLVHCAMRIRENIDPAKARCRSYLKKCFAYVASPLAKKEKACHTLANIILKAFVLNHSDKERELGCLRRREKLSKST